MAHHNLALPSQRHQPRSWKLFFLIDPKLAISWSSRFITPIGYQYHHRHRQYSYPLNRERPTRTSTHCTQKLGSSKPHMPPCFSSATRATINYRRIKILLLYLNHYLGLPTQNLVTAFIIQWQGVVLHALHAIINHHVPTAVWSRLAAVIVANWRALRSGTAKYSHKMLIFFTFTIAFLLAPTVLPHHQRSGATGEILNMSSASTGGQMLKWSPESASEILSVSSKVSQRIILSPKSSKIRRTTTLFAQNSRPSHGDLKDIRNLVSLYIHLTGDHNISISRHYHDAFQVVNNRNASAAETETEAEAKAEAATVIGQEQVANDEDYVDYYNNVPQQFTSSMPPATAEIKCLSRLMKNASYKLDIWMESNDYSYFVILGSITISWVIFSGCVIYLIKKPLDGNYQFENAIWKAWSCVASSSTHTKEKKNRMRYTTLLITLGGLLSYSLLTGTISATVKERMERVRRGDIIQMHPILEKNHVVILGYNPHVLPLLHQLNDARSFARRDHTAKDRLKVVLIYDPDLSGPDVRTIPRKEFSNLRILMRRGSLNNPSLMSLVAAQKASQIIVFPSSNLSDYKSDSEVIASLLALKSLNINLPNVVAECSKASTTNLVKNLCKDSATRVVVINQDIAPLLMVNCSKNTHLYPVYKELLSHTGTIFNVRYFPELVGLTFGQVYNNFTESIVIGIFRDGATICGPSENEVLRASDGLILLSGKRLHLRLPPGFRENIKYVPHTGVHHVSRSILSKLKKPKDNNKPIKVLENHYVKTRSGSNGKSKPTWFLHAGWTGPQSAKFLIEYDKRAAPGSTVVILSTEPIVDREKLISKFLNREITVTHPVTTKHKLYARKFENINVVHVVGNSMSQTDIFTALKLLKKFAPYREGNAKVRALAVDEPKRIINITSEDTVLACDNYKVMTSLMLQESFAANNIDAKVSCNINDGRIVKQHVAALPNINFFSTSEIMGLFTAQVAEHEYLSKVYGNLLGKGYEITFKKTNDFLRQHDGAAHKSKQNGMLDFETISYYAREKAQIPIGILTAQNEVILNPYPRGKSMIGPDDQVIVISKDEFYTRIFEH